jgi:hypothetical protein
MESEMMRLASWYDDTDYYALKALRTAVVNDMNTRAQTLQPVVNLIFNANLPSLIAEARDHLGQRLIALKFRLHMVGDLQQPLHSADDRDSCGNRQHVVTQGFRPGLA